MWVVKYLRSLVSEHLMTVNILNSLKNCTTSLPSYCFITLAKIELENIRLSVTGILGVFVNTSTAKDKYSLGNRKNSLQPIQLILFQKQKYFSQFFTAYLKSKSNVEHFQNKNYHHRLCILESTD